VATAAESRLSSFHIFACFLAVVLLAARGRGGRRLPLDFFVAGEAGRGQLGSVFFHPGAYGRVRHSKLLSDFAIDLREDRRASDRRALRRSPAFHGVGKTECDRSARRGSLPHAVFRHAHHCARGATGSGARQPPPLATALRLSLGAADQRAISPIHRCHAFACPGLTGTPLPYCTANRRSYPSPSSAATTSR
jgi:hypothetical protein